MKIRVVNKSDFKDIYNLVKEAFKTAQVSDGNEQDFVLELRKRVFYIPSLEFVAEEQGKLIGHIMFTKQAVDLEKGKLKALLIAPLCVDLARSEESRVGKEGRIGRRSRWSPYH